MWALRWPPFATTHAHSSHLYMSVHTRSHTYTHYRRSQTTQVWGGTMRRPLYAPRQPRPTTVAPPNTHAATFTHRACVCAYPPLAHSPGLTNVRGRSDSSLYIPPTTGSSTFSWFNLVKRFQRSKLQTSHICCKLPASCPAPVITQQLFLSRDWYSLVCVDGSTGIMGWLDWWTCWHSSFVFAGAMIWLELVMWPPLLLFCLLLQIIIQPRWKLSGTN